MFAVTDTSHTLLKSYARQASIGERVAQSQKEPDAPKILGRDQIEISGKAKALSFASLFSERISTLNNQSSNSLKGRVTTSTATSVNQNNSVTKVSEKALSDNELKVSLNAITNPVRLQETEAKTGRALQQFPAYGIKKPAKSKPEIVSIGSRLHKGAMPETRNPYLPEKGSAVSNFDLLFIPSLNQALYTQRAS